MMKDFNLLPEDLVASLKAMGITTPTPVQAQAIEPALEGRDVCATAQTGTGKTMAFLLPLAVNLRKDAARTALVLSPTRELAQQTYDNLQTLGKGGAEGLSCALIIGGDNIHRQFADLRKKPRVLIATPGRMIDHLERGTISPVNIRFLVLDETDRMLDMGFIADLRKIARALPAGRQTLMFSATMPQEIVGLAEQFLTEPVKVTIGSVSKPAELVQQEMVQVPTRDKLKQLLSELDVRKGSVLIFVKTKRGADRLAKDLKQFGHKANALHGDLLQNRRRQVLEQFRDESVRIMVATDVAARGIDVPHIAHVINYDLPMCPEDYIHRIGRTGRAGAVGAAISFVTEDTQKWKDICKTTGKDNKVTVKTRTGGNLPERKYVAVDLRKGDKERNRRTGANARRGNGRAAQADNAQGTDEKPARPMQELGKRVNTSRKALRGSLENDMVQARQPSAGRGENRRGRNDARSNGRGGKDARFDRRRQGGQQSAEQSKENRNWFDLGIRVLGVGASKKKTQQSQSRTGKPEGKQSPAKGKKPGFFSRFFKRKSR